MIEAMVSTKDLRNDFGLNLSSREKSDKSSAAIHTSQNTSTAKTYEPANSQTDSKALQALGFRLLELPNEVRVLIYIQLFSTQTLESFRKEDGLEKGFCAPLSFRPTRDEVPCYGLLLANRLCFEEGIKYYYQYSTVLNATCFMDWELQVNIAHRSHSEQQRFVVSHWMNRSEEIVLAKGFTSNTPLVIENTRKMVAESSRVWIDKLILFTSLQDVMIKMPRMEWDHWPELQATIPPNTRPSDSQLRFYHEGVLPDYERPTRFIKGLRRRTHLGPQETMEEELVRIMQLMPRIAFRARVPVTYKLDTEQIWEICEYDLRNLKLTDRQLVTRTEMLHEDFPAPMYSDHNYSYYN